MLLQNLRSEICPVFFCENFQKFAAQCVKSVSVCRVLPGFSPQEFFTFRIFPVFLPGNAVCRRLFQAGVPFFFLSGSHGGRIHRSVQRSEHICFRPDIFFFLILSDYNRILRAGSCVGKDTFPPLFVNNLESKASRSCRQPAFAVLICHPAGNRSKFRVIQYLEIYMGAFNRSFIPVKDFNTYLRSPGISPEFVQHSHHALFSCFFLAGGNSVKPSGMNHHGPG